MPLKPIKPGLVPRYLLLSEAAAAALDDTKQRTGRSYRDIVESLLLWRNIFDPTAEAQLTLLASARQTSVDHIVHQAVGEFLSRHLKRE